MWLKINTGRRHGTGGRAWPPAPRRVLEQEGAEVWLTGPDRGLVKKQAHVFSRVSGAWPDLSDDGGTESVRQRARVSQRSLQVTLGPQDVAREPSGGTGASGGGE